MTQDPRERYTSALSFEYDVASDTWELSDELMAAHGIPLDEQPTTQRLADRIVEQDRAPMLERLDHHRTHGGLHAFTYRVVDGEGHQRRLTYMALSEGADGAVERLSGFAVDITTPTTQATTDAVTASAEHRATIEQAKGALMLCFGIDELAAFELLRGYSSRTNIKLVTVAELIAANMTSPEFSRADPVETLLDVITSLQGLNDRDTDHAGA